MSDSRSPSQIHIHISGQDRPGILAEAFESIGSLQWKVLDIKQFVFNGLLNLSLLLEGESLSALRESLTGYGRDSGMKVSVVSWEGPDRPVWLTGEAVTVFGGTIEI